MSAYARLGVKVTPNSATLAEAKGRVVDFFKAACRSLPAVMEIYNLHDVATVSHLRSAISEQFRQNAHITDPKPTRVSRSSAARLVDVHCIKSESEFVIDMLLFKGMEELGNVVEHSKQRHHILGQYVLGRQLPGQDMKDHGDSDFLKNFYGSNYF